GFTSATWRITRHRGTATLTIRPFIRLLDEDATALAEEGVRLLAFLTPDADVRDVRFMTDQTEGRPRR
ncbi:MAG: winged helix DNA-binding domain-containing protein, partial [Actinomycetota bacterium]|nr:winged helix DNA-binding domain-containing protein [Actinomycetota bacterium]